MNHEDNWFEVLRQDMREGFAGVNARLDALNGRTRQTEQDVAVLQERSEQAKDPAARWGAGLGALLATLGAIWTWLKG